MSSTITVPAHGEGTPAEVVTLATQAKADVEALQAQTARTVQNAATGIASTDSATAANAAAPTGISNQNATLKRQEMLAALPAPVNIHAQFAAGAAINANSGFTVPFPRRTCRVVVGAMGVEVNFTVTGTDITGAPLTEPIHVAAGGGTVDGTKAFESITSFVSDVDPGDTVDLKTGKGFAVSAPFAALDVLSVDGAVETATSVAAQGTVTPTSTPDGTKVFAVRYSYAHTHAVTDPQHNHTQAAHNHPITDPQHTHALA
jgi:hypothetical protein